MPRPVPQISVLMPVRNGGALLYEAVASLLQQTFEDFEVLLVDDHSTDNAIVGLPDDPRLRVIPNRGRGIVAALNTGIGKARGEWLARMDADDICLPQRLAVQRDWLEANPHIGIAGCQVEMFAETGLGGGYRHYEQWINALTSPEAIRQQIYIESPLPHPGVMLRTDLLRHLGGYREVAWPEDYDLWLRANAAGVHMGKPRGILLRWRDTAQRLSRQDTRYSKPRFIEAKAHFLARGPLRERRAVIWGAGETGLMFHDALIREGGQVSAFIDVAPRLVGKSRRGLPVLAHTEIPDDDALILGAVATRGIRDRIRESLCAQRKAEGKDFLFVA